MRSLGELVKLLRTKLRSLAGNTSNKDPTYENTIRNCIDSLDPSLQNRHPSAETALITTFKLIRNRMSVLENAAIHNGMPPGRAQEITRTMQEMEGKTWTTLHDGDLAYICGLDDQRFTADELEALLFELRAFSKEHKVALHAERKRQR